MPFVPIIALCAALSGEPDMSQCTWVSDEIIHPRTETACVLRAQELRRSQKVLGYASKELFLGYGYVGPIGYTIYCIPEGEETDFWRNLGFPE